jgi:hypothetical protein
MKEKIVKPEETNPEQLLAELREIRKKIPFFDDGTPRPDKLDAELILRELAAIRVKIPFLDEGPPRQSEDTRSRIDDMPLETEEDFEWAAIIDGIESFHEDLRAAIERKRAAILENALGIYYAAEEASRDPANAHLIGLVEEMRAAYEREYGRPIPPKGKK